MAVQTELSSVKVRILLNNGTTDTGAIKTVTVNLNGINKAQWATTQLTAASDQKVLNIVNAIYDVLERSVYGIERIETTLLSEE